MPEVALWEAMKAHRVVLRLRSGLSRPTRGDFAQRREIVGPLILSLLL